MTLGQADSNRSSTCTVAATSGDQGHSEAWMDVVDTGDLLWWCLGAAPLLIGCLVVVYHQFLHLYKALDDWCHPEIHLWRLKHSKSVKQRELKYCFTC